jgi:hypothetical protein
MKKQRQGASRARKTAQVADLAPKSRKALAVKAGAFNAFATQQPTSADAQAATHTHWVDILSYSGGYVKP